LCDESFELIFHDRTLRGICSSLFWARFQLRLEQLVQLVPCQDAIRFPVFGTRGSDDIGRKFRAGWGLGPPDSLEVISHKLFVKRGLRAPGLVLSGGPEAGGVWGERFVDPH
jgi:hypothetical protein